MGTLDGLDTLQRAAEARGLAPSLAACYALAQWTAAHALAADGAEDCYAETLSRIAADVDAEARQ